MSSTCEETRASQLPQGNTLSSSSGINTPHPPGQNTPLLQPQHLFLLLLFYSAAWIGCNCFDCSWWRGLHTRSTLCPSLSVSLHYAPLCLSLSPSNPHALEPDNSLSFCPSNSAATLLIAALLMLKSLSFKIHRKLHCKFYFGLISNLENILYVFWRAPFQKFDQRPPFQSFNATVYLLMLFNQTLLLLYSSVFGLK